MFMIPSICYSRCVAGFRIQNEPTIEIRNKRTITTKALQSIRDLPDNIWSKPKDWIGIWNMMTESAFQKGQVSQYQVGQIVSNIGLGSTCTVHPPMERDMNESYIKTINTFDLQLDELVKSYSEKIQIEQENIIQARKDELRRKRKLQSEKLRAQKKFKHEKQEATN